MKIKSNRQIAKEKNETFYIGESPCKYGHGLEKYTFNGTCKECCLNDSKSRVKNGYFSKNYREKSEYFTKYSREKYAEDSEFRMKKLELAKEWRINNKEKSNLIKGNYRSKRRSWESNGISSKELIDFMKSAQKICFYCNTDCAENYHVDHVFPLSKGGFHEKFNLKIACQHCNNIKSAKSPLDWARDQGLEPNKIKEIEAIIFNHKDFGEVARLTINPDTLNKI